jgi:putative MATE family efflux protein
VRRTLFVLAMPVLAEQLLNTFVGLFDTYLAGRISADATEAIGLSAYVGWLVSMIVMLVGTGTTALVSRHEGAGEHGKANLFANQSMTLAAMLGLFLFVLVYTLAPWFAWYCRMGGEAYRITVNYLRVDAVGHMFMSLTLVGCAALRGVGNMRTPMYLFAIINTVNVIASFTLVYGLGPFPALGVQGIVGGTVTARVLGAFLILLLLAQGSAGLKLCRGELPLAWGRAWRILRIGLPAAADGATMWTGHFIFLAIITNLADDPLRQAYFAAHIIAVRVEAFTYLPAVAWGSATATMIGQALGARNPARAKRTGHEGVLQCGLLSLVITVLFFLGASFVYEQMSLDPQVRAEGTGPFRILALFQPLLVTSIVYIHGLRGAGDTRFPLLITLVGILIRLSAGSIFGLVLHGGLLGAWMGMFGDMCWRAGAAAVRHTRGKWVHTRV